MTPLRDQRVIHLRRWGETSPFNGPQITVCGRRWPEVPAILRLPGEPLPPLSLTERERLCRVCDRGQQ